MILLFAVFCFLGVQAQDLLEVTQLKQLYQQLGGPLWKESDNWGEGHVCSWHGVLCSAENHVVELWLEQNDLSGELTELSLPYLQSLVLHGNPGLRGSLSSLELSSELRILDVHGCDFSSLFQSFAAMRALEYLDVSGNRNLSCAFPSAIGQLSRLQHFNAAGSSLSGTLPASLGFLTELRYFNAAENDLFGDLSSLKQCANLEHVFLGKNAFSRVSFSSWPKLKSFSAPWNLLSGVLPENVSPLLTELDVSSNRFTAIVAPESWLHQEGMIFFNISNNPKLRGQLEFELSPSLLEVDLSNCPLTGTLPKLPPGSAVEHLDFSGCDFHGHLPEDYLQLPQLFFLSVSPGNPQLSAVPAPPLRCSTVATCVMGESRQFPLSRQDTKSLGEFYAVTGGGSTWFADGWGTDTDPCISGWRGVTCSASGGLTELRLPFMGVGASATPSANSAGLALLSQLATLRVVDLAGNGMPVVLPDALAQLPQLISLVIKGNKLVCPLPFESQEECSVVSAPAAVKTLNVEVSGCAIVVSWKFENLAEEISSVLVAIPGANFSRTLAVERSAGLPTRLSIAASALQSASSVVSVHLTVINAYNFRSPECVSADFSPEKVCADSVLGFLEILSYGAIIFSLCVIGGLLTRRKWCLRKKPPSVYEAPPAERELVKRREGEEGGRESVIGEELSVIAEEKEEEEEEGVPPQISVDSTDVLQLDEPSPHQSWQRNRPGRTRSSLSSMQRAASESNLSDIIIEVDSPSKPSEIGSFPFERRETKPASKPPIPKFVRSKSFAKRFNTFNSTPKPPSVPPSGPFPQPQAPTKQLLRQNARRSLKPLSSVSKSSTGTRFLESRLVTEPGSPREHKSLDIPEHPPQVESLPTLRSPALASTAKKSSGKSMQRVSSARSARSKSVASSGEESVASTAKKSSGKSMHRIPSVRSARSKSVASSGEESVAKESSGKWMQRVSSARSARSKSVASSGEGSVASTAKKSSGKSMHRIPSVRSAPIEAPRQIQASNLARKEKLRRLLRSNHRSLPSKKQENAIKDRPVNSPSCYSESSCSAHSAVQPSVADVLAVYEEETVPDSSLPTTLMTVSRGTWAEHNGLTHFGEDATLRREPRHLQYTDEEKESSLTSSWLGTATSWTDELSSDS